MDQPRLQPDEYAILVEQSPILIWRARTDGLCDYFNQRWLAFTGRTMDQEFGNGWAEGVHPDDLDRCLEIYLSHFERREIFEMEYRLRRHDGAWRWLFDRGVPMYHPDGSFGGYIGSCTDITERKEAQAALADALAARINALQELLPICMLCRKVRNDAGYWDSLEKYLVEHGGPSFSHGLCPDCYPTYMARIHAEAEAHGLKR